MSSNFPVPIFITASFQIMGS